jgi:hypothetical protein
MMSQSVRMGLVGLTGRTCLTGSSLGFFEIKVVDSFSLLHSAEREAKGRPIVSLGASKASRLRTKQYGQFARFDDDEKRR